LRSKQPFVDINCAALPEHLVESELFGYEKGAFSGAESAKPGLFELAHTGTIFLDEIGELDIKVQVKLLRILDRAPFYRLGGNRKIVVDVRVVAATNRDLKEEVRAGRFRKDLYHRLSQLELRVPPLRERPEDVRAIAERLLAQHEGLLGISPEAMQLLESYAWPGNVRELQNAINKVIFSSTGSRIESGDVRRIITDADSRDDRLLESNTLEARHNAQLTEARYEDRMDRLKAQTIQKALEKTGGHRGQAAVELGISRRTLSRKLRDFGFTSGRPGANDDTADKDRQSYRASVKIPATLIAGQSQEIACTTTNLSADGIGLEGVQKLPEPASGLRIRFALPKSGRSLEIAARLAWDDKQGGVGLIFTTVDALARHEIRLWLDQRMQEEGWPAAQFGGKTVDSRFAPGSSLPQ
jgi:hypothetical protein